MVCNGPDYGTLGNSVYLVNATARTADVNSLSSGSPAIFLQVRRIGVASSVGHFRYGMVNTGIDEKGLSNCEKNSGILYGQA